MAAWYLEYEISGITIWVSRGNEMPEIHQPPSFSKRGDSGRLAPEMTGR